MTDWREPLVPALWVAWGLYWWVAARNTKAVARRESAVSRLAHLVPLATAAILLAAPALPGWLGRRWSAPRLDVYALGVVLVVAGLLFSVWARVVLGGNWSASVTLKHGHRIVRAGPYRWVRHPIYTGLLLALLGSALARGEWRGLVALTLAAAALWRKLRVEERWLVESFGSAYADYRASTWALIPFVI